MTDPILLDFPDNFSTERLTIRCPRPGDGLVINEAVRESLEDLRAWMPWADHEPTLEESEARCRRSQARWLLREDLLLYVFLKDGTFIGASGLHRMDWSVPKFEIGYWLRTSWQGRGFMTEAVVGIADFAFHHLKAERVEIRCDSRNLKSKAVAERAGFSLEASLRHEDRDPSGELRDTLIYALLRGDWSKHNA